jgi:hypothetical protein
MIVKLLLHRSAAIRPQSELECRGRSGESGINSISFTCSDEKCKFLQEPIYRDLLILLYQIAFYLMILSSMSIFLIGHVYFIQL